MSPSWKPITLRLSHFPASALQSPRESLQPWKRIVQTILTPSLNLVCCGAHSAAENQGSDTVAGRAHWVSSFVLTLESILQMEKSQTYPSLC